MQLFLDMNDQELESMTTLLVLVGKDQEGFQQLLGESMKRADRPVNQGMMSSLLATIGSLGNMKMKVAPGSSSSEYGHGHGHQHGPNCEHGHGQLQQQQYFSASSGMADKMERKLAVC
jgi:hypothetical protein